MQSPLHAFGLAQAARPIDKSRGVWANEDPLRGYISLRGDANDAAFVEAVSRVLGGPLPTAPCSLAQLGSGKTLWLSPDEWMIALSRDKHQKLLGALREALKGLRSQVVDNSGGYTEILLRGENATDVLGHVTVYNISSLAPGRVVGTTFGKSSVYLHREGDGYCILLRRSFADYVWRTLVRACEPYGLGIQRLEPLGGKGSGGA